MEDKQLHTDDKLFRAVNDRLSNYEAPYEGAQWDAMSRSLDQLPKATRYTFKWKISLNSILIAVGILSVSILGLALTGGNKGKDKTSATTNISVVQNKNNTSQPTIQNVVLTTTSAPADQNNTSVLNDNASMLLQNTTADATLHKRKKDDNANGLYFGDQIDLRKGFIYQTQENASLVGSHTDSVPSTYYDITSNGHERTIHLKKDSTPINKTIFNADSASASTGAPTGEDRKGFDFQGN